LNAAIAARCAPLLDWGGLPHFMKPRLLLLLDPAGEALAPCDFVEDRTPDGRRFRIVNLIGERECSAIRVCRNFAAAAAQSIAARTEGP
jgi:hypothetical protein